MARKRTVGCKFTSFSWNGGPTCRLGIALDRTRKGINAQLIEQDLVGAQLEMTIEYKGGGANEGGQATLHDEIWELGPIAVECKKWTTDADHYTGALVFKVADLKDMDELAHFKGNTGKMHFKRIGDVSTDDDDAPGQQKLHEDSDGSAG